MVKFPNTPTMVVVFHDNKYMQVKNNVIEWVETTTEANKYASQYAAKNHLKRLTGIPDDVSYMELK